MNNYIKCNDKRDWCKARHDGKCLALSETFPSSRPCPFYKSIDDFRNEVKRLEKFGHLVCTPREYMELHGGRK